MMTNILAACGLILVGTGACLTPPAGLNAQEIPPPAKADESGVRQAALDYMEGALNADAKRVAQGVHEELNKVQISILPEGQRQVLLYNTASTLVSAVQAEGDGAPSPDDKTVQVTVFDVHGDIAAARAVGSPWYDLLHLVRIDGKWRIVNVLWAPRQADAESLTTDPGARGEVETVAMDFIEGIYSGDAERVGRAIHPELHKVLLRNDAGTPQPFLYKMGASSLLGATEANLFLTPEAEWQIAVEIFDICHDMASVKVTSAKFTDQLLLGRVNGEWKVVNDLWVANPEAFAEGG